MLPTLTLVLFCTATPRKNGKTTTAKRQKQKEKTQKYTLFNLLARRGKIKISKNCLKIKGRGKSF